MFYGRKVSCTLYSCLLSPVSLGSLSLLLRQSMPLCNLHYRQPRRCHNLIITSATTSSAIVSINSGIASPVAPIDISCISSAVALTQNTPPSSSVFLTASDVSHASSSSYLTPLHLSTPSLSPQFPVLPWSCNDHFRHRQPPLSAASPPLPAPPPPLP